MTQLCERGDVRRNHSERSSTGKILLFADHHVASHDLSSFHASIDHLRARQLRVSAALSGPSEDPSIAHIEPEDIVKYAFHQGAHALVYWANIDPSTAHIDSYQAGHYPSWRAHRHYYPVIHEGSESYLVTHEAPHPYHIAVQAMREGIYTVVTPTMNPSVLDQSLGGEIGYGHYRCDGSETGPFTAFVPLSFQTPILSPGNYSALSR